MTYRKYGNRKVEIDGVTFDSIAEARRYQELKLLETAGEIDYADFRRWALEPLTERLATLPPSRLYPLWQETLRRRAQHGRGHLLWDLLALRPALEVLGGEEALQETVEALTWAGEWWP